MSAAPAGVFDRIKQRSARPDVMTFYDYLDRCASDKAFYAKAPGRLLKAMGEPEIVETSTADPRLGRAFQNRRIKRFKSFDQFYGIEPVIEEIYNFLQSADQGLEEERQILYLLGPVGSAKSSLAEKLKELAEQEPIYVLAVPKKGGAENELELSPIYETPLGLIPKDGADEMMERYKVPPRYFTGICSPWAVKRLEEFGGDVSKFNVVKIYPSRLKEIAIAKTEPGDENNQDISSLVGKVDVRKLEDFAINDPDAYSYSGSLCKASQGLMEFVEMFKAPIKTLHPLLTATQERNFLGTQPVGAIPFNGIVLAHSNEAEWDKFSKNKNNEAFLDRVRIVKVPYNKRITEEQLIYQKLLRSSALAEIPVAPDSLELLARIVVASRLKPESAKVKMPAKILIYDGQSVRETLPTAPTLYELTELAGPNEGMTGISTRTAFKIISRAANRGEELAIDPIEILETAREEIRSTYGTGSPADGWLENLNDFSSIWLKTQVHTAIRESLLDNFDAYGQTLFERYIEMATIWTDADVGAYKDPDTGMMLNKDQIATKLSEIEKPVGVENPKDFRNEMVLFVQRHQIAHDKQYPRWTANARMKKVIQVMVNNKTSDFLPFISFGAKRNEEEERKHAEFVDRMAARGYTPKQVRRIVAWHEQSKASS